MITRAFFMYIHFLKLIATIKSRDEVANFSMMLSLYYHQNKFQIVNELTAL